MLQSIFFEIIKSFFVPDFQSLIEELNISRNNTFSKVFTLLILFSPSVLGISLWYMLFNQKYLYLLISIIIINYISLWFYLNLIAHRNIEICEDTTNHEWYTKLIDEDSINFKLTDLSVLELIMFFICIITNYLYICIFYKLSYVIPIILLLILFVISVKPFFHYYKILKINKLEKLK